MLSPSGHVNIAFLFFSPFFWFSLCCPALFYSRLAAGLPCKLSVYNCSCFHASSRKLLLSSFPHVFLSLRSLCTSARACLSRSIPLLLCLSPVSGRTNAILCFVSFERSVCERTDCHFSATVELSRDRMISGKGL